MNQKFFLYKPFFEDFSCDTSPIICRTIQLTDSLCACVCDWEQWKLIEIWQDEKDKDVMFKQKSTY